MNASLWKRAMKKRTALHLYLVICYRGTPTPATEFGKSILLWQCLCHVGVVRDQVNETQLELGRRSQSSYFYISMLSLTKLGAS